MRPNQAGFEPKRGYADQIFTLRVLEHRFKYQQPTEIFMERASSLLVRARSPSFTIGVDAYSLFAKPCDGLRQKRGRLIEAWTDTFRKDFERIDGPAIYGLRRWKKEWLLLLSTMASDRIAWKRFTLVAVGTSLTSNDVIRRGNMAIFTNQIQK
ncbi:unnamed protein product [Dracunculus medinensis]|uniref:Uncharacterized protein n=1 Tax=Dracunculus medinensis TaxID=318479 RepID=A0A0N4U4P8_DRAME|nr:unnamed protein product [Dracunculus medinensis]